MTVTAYQIGYLQVLGFILLYFITIMQKQQADMTEVSLQ